MIRRRSFLTLAGAAAALPRVALTQQAVSVPRLAYIGLPTANNQAALIQGLADVGYVDGRNIGIHFFFPPTSADIPEFAAKAIATKPDLIVATGLDSVRGVAALTRSIPIVFEISSDPVTTGVVTNLARPGGNLTGSSAYSNALGRKHFEILRDLLPRASRVAFFGVSATNPVPTVEAQAAARAMDIDLIVVDVLEDEPWTPYFKKAKDAGAQGIVFSTQNYFGRPNDGTLLKELKAQHGTPSTEIPASTGKTNNEVIAYLALVHGLPSVSAAPAVPDAGGLVSYGASGFGAVRRLGPYVDAILKGTKPGDLAVELATAFDFVINLKTAKALGLTIPAPLLVQATRLIE